jgi:hypothetical protein
MSSWIIANDDYASLKFNLRCIPGYSLLLPHRELNLLTGMVSTTYKFLLYLIQNPRDKVTRAKYMSLCS